MAGVSKKQFISGAAWKITGEFSAKGISFLVSIVLARLLDPADYGLLALTAVFTTFSDMLIDGGFGTALVRKEKVDDFDYTSVQIVSLSIALVLYAGIFLAAPAVGRYYEEPQLAAILRVITLVLFVHAAGATRNAYVARNMQFRLLFVCNFIACLLSGLTGIAAAACGLGVWALVIQQLSQTVIATALLFVKIRLPFSLRVQGKRIMEMLRFGLGVVGSSVLNYLASSISNVVIGKHFSVGELGISDKGGQIPMQLSLYTFGAMSGVLLPTLSSYQNDIPAVRRILRKVVRMTAFLLVPMMIGLALTAEEVTVLLLTEKWLPIVRIMRYSCLYYLATPFMLINVQLFFALGHSFLRVKTELVRLAMICLSLVLCVTLRWDIYELSLAGAVIAVLSALLTYFEANRLIGYRFTELLADLAKPMLCGAAMGGFVLLVHGLISRVHPCPYLLSAVIKVAAGVLCYGGLSVLLKPDGYTEILKMLSGLRRKPNE